MNLWEMLHKSKDSDRNLIKEIKAKVGGKYARAHLDGKLAYSTRTKDMVESYEDSFHKKYTPPKIIDNICSSPVFTCDAHLKAFQDEADKTAIIRITPMDYFGVYNGFPYFDLGYTTNESAWWDDCIENYNNSKVILLSMYPEDTRTPAVLVYGVYVGNGLGIDDATGASSLSGDKFKLNPSKCEKTYKTIDDFIRDIVRN